MEVLRRSDWTAADIGELYGLASGLAAEDAEHFAVHADANEVVHIFRRADTGRIVGFQFWSTLPVDLPRSRLIAGGKLRVVPEFRNRGLHLLSGLTFFLQNQLLRPRTRFYRVSLASIFGFVSITQALAEYRMIDTAAPGDPEKAIGRAVLSWAAQNHFVPREDTGLFFVDIFTTEHTLARYPAAFFERSAAREYAARNPDFRTNGCYAAFWFRFGPRNVIALTNAVARKLRR
jgi:hypothetical protein